MAERVLILGASGFIGSYLHECLSSCAHRVITGTFFNHSVPGLVPLNVLDAKAMQQLIAEFRPQLVVFLAGTKDVERCERHPAYALDLNVQAVRNYVDACSSSHQRPFTLFFSTDYVFDGRVGEYTESCVAGPHTVYGLTNLLAEKMLECSGLPGILLRVSAVMGRRGGFFRWLENSLTNEQTIELFDNTYFSPTSIRRLCLYIERCATEFQTLTGWSRMRAVHLNDGYRMTRYQFGCMVARKLGKPLHLLRPSLADLRATTFQPDISLLPDGMTVFHPVEDWDELENIF